MKKLEHIPSLDGIRALVVLVVFFSHVPYFGHIAPGGVGVTILYFLSGFIISTLMRVEYENNKDVCFKKFFTRRIYRIFPPLYVVIILVLLLIYFGVIESSFTVGGLLSNVFHYTNYFVILGDRNTAHLLPGMAVTWSLAVQEHFYLLFPMLFLIGAKRLNRLSFIKVLVCICIVVFCWRYYLLTQDGEHLRRIFWATFARIDSILFGVILAMAYNPALDKKPETSNKVQFGVLIVAIGVLFFTLIPKNHLFREVFRYSIQGIALMPIFYLAISQHNWLIFKALNTWPIRWLGKISYTFYLSHGVALIIVDKYFGDNPVFAVGVALVSSIVFSVLMHFLVEKRIRPSKKKLNSKEAFKTVRS
jgi:peptidoglycan/LPS O-acetylase OafA/YrhL